MSPRAEAMIMGGVEKTRMWVVLLVGDVENRRKLGGSTLLCRAYLLVRLWTPP